MTCYRHISSSQKGQSGIIDGTRKGLLLMTWHLYFGTNYMYGEWIVSENRFFFYKHSVSVNVWPALTAIFGNCLVLFVFWRRSLYKRPVNWFIVNLAVADLSVSLFAHPMSAVAAFNQRYENQSGNRPTSNTTTKLPPEFVCTKTKHAETQRTVGSMTQQH